MSTTGVVIRAQKERSETRNERRRQELPRKQKTWSTVSAVATLNFILYTLNFKMFSLFCGLLRRASL